METVAGLGERCKTSRLVRKLNLVLCRQESFLRLQILIKHSFSCFKYHIHDLQLRICIRNCNSWFRGKRWFPLSNATKINFYSLMKGAFSASQQTGSVSRHYPSTLITFYPLPGRNWTCGTYAPGVTAAMLVYSMLPSIRTLQFKIPITFLC